jgi:hypothetical protein
MTGKRLNSTSSIEAGESIGSQLMPLLKFAEERVDDPVHFWAGFMSHIAGQMVASIGGEASEVIAKAVGNCSVRLYQEKQDHAH